jgi:hypothetical protein
MTRHINTERLPTCLLCARPTISVSVSTGTFIRPVVPRPAGQDAELGQCSGMNPERVAPMSTSSSSH